MFFSRLIVSILARNSRSRIFTEYEIGGERSAKILAFILDYFQEKLMTKFFKKSKKKQIWSKINFCGKEGYASF